MKTYIYITIVLIASVMTAHSQGEKIKGNRNVTVKQTYVDDFQSLIIKNNFEVNIVYNSKPSVEIEADDNLHDVIDISSNDGTLSISTSRRITSKRKLIITINYGELLKDIQLVDEAELRSLTSIEVSNLNLKTAQNSRAYLNVKASSFGFTATDKSKSRLNIVADSTQFVLSDNTNLDALVNSKSSKFDMYQRADASIEGDSEMADLRIDNSASFSGKNFTTNQTNLLIETNSNATLFVSKTLNLEASGSSEVYVYGDPKINLNTFTGTAKLQKKDINSKGLFN